MFDKQQLCDAFCGDLIVKDLPAGLAVSTGFRATDGDSIDFYIMRHPHMPEQYRLEDSGLLIPMLEGSGFNLDTGTRAQVFKTLLSEHNAIFDEDELGLHTEYVKEADLPSAAMRFLTLMIRVRDLELLNTDNVENTFREDAERALTEQFANSAKIEFHKQVSEANTDYVADALIQSLMPNGNLLALYFGTTEAKVDEAVMLWMEQRMSPAKKLPRVALLLETEKPTNVGARALRRAMNRIEIAAFRGDEAAAMARIASFVDTPSQYAQ